MLEKEILGYVPKVEILHTQEQSGPFSVRKNGLQWQLGVNKSYFESKGFLPDEINGAICLEEERIARQTDVATQTGVEGLKRWQETGRDDPKASPFKAVFERLASLASLEERDLEKAKLARKYLVRFASRSPNEDYTDQLFGAILKKGLGEEVTPENKLVANVFNNLQKQEKIEGKDISPLDALVSPNISSAARTSWFEARFVPRLKFLERQEQTKKAQESDRQKEQANQEQENQPPNPPATQDEYEQHRGREEKTKGGQPTFVIDPGFTGYWEEDSFDSIDEGNGRLIKSDTQRIKTAISTALGPCLEDSKRVISGNTGINLFSLPLAPAFVITQDGLNKLKTQGIQIYIDAEGHTFLRSAINQQIKAEIALSMMGVTTGIKSKDNSTQDQNIPKELDTELTRVRSLSVDSLGKIQQLVDFIKTNFKYPPDDQVESMYKAVDNSQSRISAMTQGKLLDCYLAREFFLSALKRLNLPDVEWRGVNGHFVGGKQKDGTTQIHSGTAHAWVKLRLDGQRVWTIIDPTPPGDPIHQKEGSMDEFGEFSNESISDEDLKDLANETKAISGDSEKKPSSTADQYLMQFAREAGLTPEEATQILNTLAQVDQMKDRQGRLITARLREQYERIIEQYINVRREPLGAVEMSRGKDLEEPVSALIDFRTGNLDPNGFLKKRQVEEKEEFYSGWDLEIIADGSGSMNEFLGRKQKYLIQRDMNYLMHRELHRFSQDAQRRRLRLVTPLKIRSGQYIFRENKIEEIKPLSDEFTPAQMALLWKKSAENIGGGTPAHLGLQAVLDRIPPQEVQLLKDKKLLKVVALVSDGGYDDPRRVSNLIKRLEEMNVIVAEFPITDEGSLERLPEAVAEKVIEEAALLMPKRIKKR